MGALYGTLPANPYRSLEVSATADWHYDEHRSVARALGAGTIGSGRYVDRALVIG